MFKIPSTFWQLVVFAKTQPFWKGVALIFTIISPFGVWLTKLSNKKVPVFKSLKSSFWNFKIRRQMIKLSVKKFRKLIFFVRPSYFSKSPFVLKCPKIQALFDSWFALAELIHFEKAWSHRHLSSDWKSPETNNFGVLKALKAVF